MSFGYQVLGFGVDANVVVTPPPSGGSLSTDNVQGVFGDFVPVIDANNISTSVMRMHGVFGDFVPVIDTTEL